MQRSMNVLGVLGLLAAAACGGGGGGPPADGGVSELSGQPDLVVVPGRSFDTAIALTVDGTVKMGRLVDAASKDYYKVTLTRGDRIAFVTQSRANMVSDGSVTDTVITVWDAAKAQVAQDDDGWPRLNTDSSLDVTVAADGLYYVTIEDCNSAFSGGGASCTAPSMITDFRYSVGVFHTSMSNFPETNAAATQNGTVANAQTVTYKLPTGAMTGNYGNYILDGSFKSTTDTHVFGFTPPADTAVDMNQRAHAEFFVQPVGVMNGNGSTANVKVWVTDSTGTTILAQADQNHYRDGDNPTNGPLDLSVPVTRGQKYYLFVQNTASASAPTTDYYFVQHFVGSWWYGQPEQEAPTLSGTNDLPAAAEVLTTPTTATAGTFFVDGNLAIQGADVDWFEADPPTGTISAFLSCTSLRDGSGVGGFTAGLYDAQGTTLLGSIGPETATADLSSAKITVPGGTTKALLKISASSQDATNTGTFYRCAVTYSNM